jgi:hypothetical protein
MFVIKLTIAILFMLLVIGVVQSKRLENIQQNTEDTSEEISEHTLVDEETETVENFDNNFLKFD